LYYIFFHFRLNGVKWVLYVLILIFLTLKRPLGELAALKIWHDNSGSPGNEASWYLKHIAVHDLQTREKFYFLCEKWLAIDKDDGQIERVLSISRKPEITSVKYLFSRRAKDNLNDDHLWFSIFSRPVQSSFTRLDRLTCCFVLLSISMLMNIMYYEKDTSPSEDGLTIGPYFNLTLNQLSSGIITSLIVFVPSLLLVQLFRRIKRKNTRLAKLKKILKDSDSNVEMSQKQKNSIFPCKFPWWFKIVPYFLSFVFTSVSLVFVIIKGIEFGDAQVTKWLTSLIISFLSSILFTQPLKVALMTFLFVLLCRKFENKNEMDNEGDDEMSLNKIETKNVKLISILI
jgi:polycystin 1L2